MEGKLGDEYYKTMITIAYLLFRVGSVYIPFVLGINYWMVTFVLSGGFRGGKGGANAPPFGGE